MIPPICADWRKWFRHWWPIIRKGINQLRTRTFLAISAELRLWPISLVPRCIIATLKSRSLIKLLNPWPSLSSILENGGPFPDKICPDNHPLQWWRVRMHGFYENLCSEAKFCKSKPAIEKQNATDQNAINLSFSGPRLHPILQRWSCCPADDWLQLRHTSPTKFAATPFRSNRTSSLCLYVAASSIDPDGGPPPAVIESPMGKISQVPLVTVRAPIVMKTIITNERSIFFFSCKTVYISISRIN